jgi:hypothetical protein
MLPPVKVNVGQNAPGHYVRHWNVARRTAVTLAMTGGRVVRLVTAFEQQLDDFTLTMYDRHVERVHHSAS